MWSSPQETPDLVTFTEEILDGKLHFLCGGRDNSPHLPYTLVEYSEPLGWSISHKNLMAKSRILVL